MTLVDTVVDTVSDALGISGNDWVARLRPEIKLVSPEGTEFTGKWIGDPREKAGKVALFNFPGVRGTVVQDLLPESDRYSISIYFDGPNHDTTADDFFKKCNEKGTWDVVHPVHGFVALQLLNVREMMEPVRNGNYTVFETQWIEPIDPATLQTITELRAAIGAELDDLNIQAASQFAKVMTATVAATSSIEKVTNKIITATDRIMNPLILSNAGINKSFQAAQRSIGDILDAAILRPLELAGATQNLIQLPALALQDVQERLAAYGALAEETIGISANDINAAYTKELALVSIVGANAQISATGINGLQNRAQAIEFGQTLSDQFKTITNAIDEDQKAFESLAIDDQFFSQSESYTEALNITALGIQNFLLAAFNLSIEKRFTLTHYKTPVQITVEEYGTLGTDDENLDLFINSNKLTGKDILLLPPGREVIVYV